MESLSALEAVRRRPEMYFDLGQNLMNQYVFGAMCLALADAHCGSTTRIQVTVDGWSFSVEDDGGGVRLSDRPDGERYIERMMTELFACRDAKEHDQLKHELCGAGLAAINALAASASIETVVDGICWAQTYERGAPSAPVAMQASLDAGTRLHFRIADDFRGTELFDQDQLMARIGLVSVDLDSCAIELSVR